MGCASSKTKEVENKPEVAESSKPIPDPLHDSDPLDEANLTKLQGDESQQANGHSTPKAATSTHTEGSQASNVDSAAPGNVVFEIDGKRVDLVVAKEEVDFSLEPDYEPPPLPPPDIEEARCRALQNLGLDYQSEEPSLNFITKICGDLFHGTVSFIMFIDSDNAYVKSSCPPMLQKAPADRRVAVASWMLLSLKPEMLVVEDMKADRRFRRHPFVIEAPFFRSCAAVPLLEKNGHRIGILGVIGFAPQKFSGEMRSLLCNLADMAMKEINLLSENYLKLQRKASQDLLHSLDSLNFNGYVESSKDCILLLDMSQPGWQILLSNQKWIQATGVDGDCENSLGFWDSFQLANSRSLGSATGDAIHFAGAIQCRSTFQAVMVAKEGWGDQEFFVSFKPATSEQVDNSLPRVKIPATGNTRSKKTDDRPFYFAILKPRQRMSVPRPGGWRGLEDSLAEAEEPPIPGLRLGALLGRGSFGRVHLGEWSPERGGPYTKVAVKVIRMALTREEEKAEGEHMEAIIGQQLVHPNVVRTLQSGSRRIQEPSLHMSSLHSAGSISGSELDYQHAREQIDTWIILELCTEGSLQEAIDRADYKVAKDARWVPNVSKIVRTAAEIASAMAFLHSKDILHSDLSSSNVLLSRQTGTGDDHIVAKVSDFGLSRVHAGQRTVATMSYGTVTHMPPELLLENRLSKAADVYSFGVVLWELYTGDRPWAGLRHAQIVAAKIRGHPAGELQWPPGSNKAIKAIGLHCMQPDPHDRPTFDKVVEMLKPLCSTAPVGQV